MSISKNLRKERTNTGEKGTKSFYSTQVFIPPYGKAKFQIGGRGLPGNNVTPGYANPPDYTTNSPIPGNTTPASGSSVVYHIQILKSGGSESWYDQGPDWSGSQPSPSSWYASTTGNSALYNSSYTSTTYYVDTPASSNPPTPGYNNPPTWYTNPSTPGTAAAPFTYMGVTFPGGAAGAQAADIIPVYKTFTYTPTGTPVTVPSGARVDIIIS